MLTLKTKLYWLDVFDGWIEAREMPGPQDEEAHIAVRELKKLLTDIESGVITLEMPREDCDMPLGNVINIGGML